MTSDVISQILTGGLVVLALVIVALAIDRRRWQEIAQNRHRFILDLKAASRCPQSWVFGPSYLAELRRRLESAECWAAHLASCLEATSQELDRQRARADAVTGHAKRWARFARSRVEVERIKRRLLKGATVHACRPPQEDVSE